MLLPLFKDLVKPQWRAVIEELKITGDSSVSDLARSIGGSYMAIKTHCEDLTKAGYLVRTRLPRTEVGRPEIHYSLSTKADLLFPQVDTDFALEILDAAQWMFGESAPEKLIFQYLKKQGEQYAQQLEKLASTEQKALKLAILRTKQGYAAFCKQLPGEPLRIVELHNPLQGIFGRYPRAVTMELRMLEQVLDTKLTRSELPSGRETTPCVVFEIL